MVILVILIVFTANLEVVTLWVQFFLIKKVHHSMTFPVVTLWVQVLEGRRSSFFSL